MKSIFLLLFFSIFLTDCGGYLPSPPTNWSANSSEKYVWNPPDKEKLSIKKENQEKLDFLAGQIEKLFVNYASLLKQELTMNEMVIKRNAEIDKTDRDFSDQIEKQLQRNKIMQADLNEVRVKYNSQNEIIRKLSEIKPLLIFSTKDYNYAMKAFSEGNYGVSIYFFKKLLSQNPPKFLKDNIYFGMGSSYFRLKNYQKAKSHFQKIIDNFKMGDKRFNSYAMLGIIHNMEGEKSRALYMLDEALKNNPPEKIKPLLRKLMKNINENAGYASN